MKMVSSVANGGVKSRVKGKPAGMDANANPQAGCPRTVTGHAAGWVNLVRRFAFQHTNARSPLWGHV